MSNYKIMQENSDSENDNFEENQNECIICFELCKDKIHYFCKNCKHKFHTHCFLTWKNKCKELGNSYKKCCYCQTKKSIYKRDKIFCFYFNDKL